jgi:putative selenium metabolism protein SsnA
MSDVAVVGNGVVVTAFSDAEVIPAGAVAWEGQRIVQIGTASELRSAYPNARYLDAHNGLIMPGLVNLHHHFYSALARGFDPGAPMANFAEVLDRLWWRLDRALDAETVRISAELSAADCIRWGCTTVFDHHASPSCISGSLDIIANALEIAGLSAVLCYEVTDRNGKPGATSGLDENLAFTEARREHPRIRGTVGLHASFTLRDDTLALAADRRHESSGCHIHVAEDPVDVDASRAAFGRGPVERLVDFGLLDERSLLAHGIHLEPKDYRTIAQHKGVVVHNPESNANNGVGHLDVVQVAQHGCLVGLGTDGMSSSMFRALRAAFLAHRAARGDPSAGFDVLPDLLGNNVLTARRFFDEPLLGELTSGAPADLIVIDAQPPTPIGQANLFGHLVYGATEYPVRHTVAGGEVVLENFTHTTIDTERLTARAREVAPAIWKRIAALPWGTSFLGD